MFDLIAQGLQIQQVIVEANKAVKASPIRFPDSNLTTKQQLNEAFHEGLILQDNPVTGQRLKCERLIAGFVPVRGTFKLIEGGRRADS